MKIELLNGLGIVELINFMGDDLEVVNDAKSSFNRVANALEAKEKRLIGRLTEGITEPQHTSPLRGTVVKFRVSAPLAIARQWYKHHVGSNHTDEQDQWNEQSYRFTKVEPDFYIPDVFHYQDPHNKQAVGDPLPDELQEKVRAIYDRVLNAMVEGYEEMIALGTARDEARGVTPVCLFTSWTWTTSLEAALHFCDLREGHGAQKAIVPYAEAVKDCLRAIAPTVCAEWDKRKARMRKAMELLKEWENQQ